MIVPDYTPRNIIHHTFGEQDLEEELSPEGRQVLASLTHHTAVPSSTILELRHGEATSCDFGRAQRLQAELIDEFSSHPEEDVRALAEVVPAAVSCTHHVHERIATAATLDLPLDRVCQYTTPFVKACLQAAFPEAFVAAKVLYALSRPPGALESPLSWLLPRYSSATFGFLPVHGDDGSQTSEEDSEEPSCSDGEPGDFGDESFDSPSPVTPPQTRFFQLPPPEEAPSMELVVPDDYDWTLEKFVKLKEIWVYRKQGLESESEDSASSQILPSGHRSEDDEEEVAPETELLARGAGDKICILVLAESAAEITQALVSAAYHRRAWGITTPVLGVIVEPRSPVLRFAMAWVEDPGCTNPDELPAVHVARAPESVAVEGPLSSDPDLGRFHVGDLRSSLAFAMAVLSQKATLSLDSVSARDPGVAERCAWRTDRIPHIPDEDDCEVDPIDYVSSWIDDAAGLAEAPIDNNSTGMAGDKKQPSKTKDAQAPQAAKTLSASSARSSSAPPSERNSTKTKLTALSCSAMARLKVDKITGGPEPTTSWLVNRHTTVIPFPPEYAYQTVPRDKDLAAHFQLIRPHVEMYYAYMSLNSDDFVLTVPEHRDGAVVTELKAFLAAVKVHEPAQGVVPDEQAQALSAFLQVHLPDLLSVVSDARDLVRGAEREGDKTVLYSEAEYRKVWDKLLGICLKGKLKDGGSGKSPSTVHYRCEPLIKLPRNEVHDFLTKNKPLQSDLQSDGPPWHTLMSQTMRLLSSQKRFYEKLRNDRATIPDIWEDAEAVIRTNTLALDKLFKDQTRDLAALGENGAVKVVTTQMHLDPRWAKCDVLGFLRLPHQLASKFDLQKIFSVPVGPAPRTVEEVAAVVDSRDPRLRAALLSDSESSLHLSFCSMRNIANLNRVEGGAAALSDVGGAVEDSFARLALDCAEEGRDARDASEDGGPDTRDDVNRQAEGIHVDQDQGSKGGKDDSGNKDSDGQGEGGSEHHLRVPFFAVEYKKAGGDERQGVNQLRVYNTALSKYLAHLGVEDFPTFGLVTDGAMGFVTCTFTTSKFTDRVWFDRDARVYQDHEYTPPITYIMEHNPCGFNITRPGDMLNLVVFLHRLSHSYAQELAKRLRETEKAAERTFPVDWAQEVQNPQGSQPKRDPAANSSLPLIIEDEDEEQNVTSE